MNYKILILLTLLIIKNISFSSPSEQDPKKPKTEHICPNAPRIQAHEGNDPPPLDLTSDNSPPQQETLPNNESTTEESQQEEKRKRRESVIEMLKNNGDTKLAEIIRDQLSISTRSR